MFKKIFLLGTLITALYSPVSLAAKDTIISLIPTDPFEETLCQAPQWSGVKLAWGGVKDIRPSKAIASLLKKGKTTLEYSTQKPLSDYFEQYIPKILQKCGIQFVSLDSKPTYKLTVIIDTFSAQMGKSMIKSSTEATSKVTLNFDSEFNNIDVNIGYIMDNQGASFKSKKKLEKLLQDLFKGTLTEMIESHQINFLKKE